MERIFLLIFLLLLLPVASFAEAQPPLPVIDTYYGSVTLRGIPAPAGTAIGIQLGSSYIGNTSVKADGTYKAYIGVGELGDSVIFLINGAVVGTATRSGKTQNLNLTLTPSRTIREYVNSTNNIIDFRNEYVGLNIRTNRDVLNEMLSIELYNNGAGTFSIDNGKYIKGIVIGFNNSPVNNATITIHYTDSDISGIDESSVKIYYYNLSTWELIQGRLDINSNTITADIQHFSTYALFGNIRAEPPYVPPITTGGGGGGGAGTNNNTNTTKNTVAITKNTTLAQCTSDWSCGEWSSCKNNAQTRTCADKNNCGTTENRPPLTQDCILLTLPDEKNVSASPEPTPTGLISSAAAKSAGIVAVILIIIAAVWYAKKKHSRK